MRNFLLAASLLLSFGLSAVERPNIIIINIDDMGYGDIAPFGSKINRTPNLDRMAAEGCKLTSYYAEPVCSPSRAALMTGCYSKRVLPIKRVLFPIDKHGLHPDEITIAEVAKSAGYATACIGKWHLGDQPEFFPTKQGFDVFYGLPYSNDMSPNIDGGASNLGQAYPKVQKKFLPPLALIRQDKVLTKVTAADQVHLVENYTKEAKAFMTANKDKPFLLYIPHSAVHFPIYPGKAFAFKSPHGLYSDWVEEVDWSVGQILDHVRELGMSERTFVLFTSDNGANRDGSNAPLRGYKNSSWEGGVREPAIVWMPKTIPAGSSHDAICGMIDVLPTIAELTGAKAPTDRVIDGRSMWPMISGAADAKPARDVHYYFHDLVLKGVRKGKWKLHIDKDKTELFDLDADIGETTDVAARHPEVVAELQALMAAQDKDLGTTAESGPGVRPLGLVEKPLPLIDAEGKVRPELAP